MQFFELFASVQSSVIESGVVRTGLKTTFLDIFGYLSRKEAILTESEATCLRVSGPYRC
jgi:hypothetical protein